MVYMRKYQQNVSQCPLSGLCKNKYIFIGCIYTYKVHYVYDAQYMKHMHEGF